LVARGGYSEVYTTHWRCHTQPNLILVCYKVLRPPVSHLKTVIDEVRKVVKHLKREMKVWKSLKHPNIVKSVGFAIEHNSYRTNAALVSEWCEHGDVVQYLEQNPSVDRGMLVRGVAEGLSYLHNQKPPVIHGDVKPLNVLINDIGCAQLCDFGLSRILDDLPSGHTTSLQMGTLRYQAPELLEGDDTREKWHPTTEGDIFAFACTSVRILFDKEPYHWCKNDSKVMKAILQGEAPWVWGDTSLEQILVSCCRRSSSDRPSMSDVVAALSAHPPN